MATLPWSKIRRHRCNRRIKRLRPIDLGLDVLMLPEIICSGPVNSSEAKYCCCGKGILPGA